jgi:hypothetical protein
MLLNSCGDRQSPGWTPIRTSRSGICLSAQATATDESRRIRVRLAHVITGDLERTVPEHGDHIFM